MEWFPTAVAAGGPWAILGAVVFTVVGLIVRGTLVPGTHVDRLVKAYERIIDDKRDEATAWKAAHALEVQTGRELLAQNGKLLEHSSVSAHAWDGIREAAERAGREAA